MPQERLLVMQAVTDIDTLPCYSWPIDSFSGSMS
jgi:hypothetical protein